MKLWHSIGILCVIFIILSLAFTACGDDDDDDDNDDDNDDREDMPDSVIVAGSRTHTYVLLDPTTGEDILEVSPDTFGPNNFVLGYEGQRVYFISATGAGSGCGELYGCDALTGDNVQQLTSIETDTGLEDLDGSPAAAKIAYAACFADTGADDDENEGAQIFTINEDGTGQTKLTAPDESLTLPDATPVITLWAHQPAWSPDGSQIAYQGRVCEPESIGTQYEVIIVMSASGGNKEIIFSVSGTGHYDDVCWTSDGNFVMFSHDVEGVRVVKAVHVASQTESDLSDALTPDSWTYGFGNMWTAPAGMQVAVTNRAAGGGKVHLATLEADGQTLQVTETPEQITVDDVGHGYAEPDWGPYAE